MRQRKKRPARCLVSVEDAKMITSGQRKLITPKDAQKIAEEYGIKVSMQTIMNWIDKKKLGYQPSGNNGHWRVFEDKFRNHVSGDKEYNTEV